MTKFIKSLKKIEALRNLPVGWDYGRDGPPSDKAVKNAYALLTSLHFLNTDSFEVLPGRGHGIALVAIKGNYAAEIHINADGTYNLVHEQSGTEIADEQNIGLNHLICILETQGWHSARLFVSCIQGDTAKVWGATPANLSPQGLTVVSQLFVGTASKERALKFAPTSKNTTTAGYQEHRQSSGEYRAVPFRQAYA
jgi:hypothetical protein